MTDLTGLVKAFMEWFPHPIKVMTTIVLVAGSALFLPRSWETRMGVAAFINLHPVILWSIFLFCAVLLTLMLMELGHRHYMQSRDLKTRMDRLSGPEKQTIISLLMAPHLSCNRWPYDPEVLHLHRDGILWREDMGINGLFTYGLERPARRFLERHPLPEMKNPR
jgi:hypothetical protein